MFFYKKDKNGDISMFYEAENPLASAKEGWESTEDEIIELHDGSIAFKKDVDMNKEKDEIERKNKQASITKEINSLKAELEKTDYKCLKYVDGALTDDEYSEVKEYRKKLRTKINELEGVL